jgi:CBS domain-containing protein
MTTTAKSLHELRVHVQHTSAPDSVSTRCLVPCPRTGAYETLEHCTECERYRRVDRRQGSLLLVCDAGAGAPSFDVGSFARTAASSTPVAELMAQHVLCVTPELALAEVARIFRDHAVSGVPVVDERGTPIGVISKTDVVGSDAELESCCASEVMTSFTFGVAEETSIAQAAALMAHEGVHRMIVLSREGLVVGLLSSLDIARWVAADSGYVVSSPAGHVR